MRSRLPVRLLLALAAVGCADGPRAALAGEEIAIAGPMTGAYGDWGAALRAASGPSGSQAVLVEDDQCRADTAVEVAMRLVARRPALVIGHPCSSAALAAAPIYAAARIPFVGIGARQADLTDQRAGPLVFRLAGRDDRQPVAAAEFLRRAADGRAIAILHDRTFAMSTLAAETARALSGAPGAPAAPPVMQFPFVASEFNYDALADKVAAYEASTNGLGGVLFAGYPAEAVVILKALRARGVMAPFLGADALATGEGGAAIAAQSGEAHVLISSDAGTESLAERAQLAFELWNTARGLNPQDPAAALATVAVDHRRLGRVAFDAKGDAVLPSYVVAAWQDGAWRPVATPHGEAIPIPK